MWVDADKGACVVRVCMCVNLINDWQRSPTALVMCLDQCYKQGVKGLPSTSPLNDWPLVQVDGWKCSNINDQVPRRPVARWNEQRSLQPPTTINRPEPVCQPFVITYSTCGPLLNPCWTCLSIFTQCSLHWFEKNVQWLMAKHSSPVIFGYVLCFFVSMNKQPFLRVMYWMWTKPCICNVSTWKNILRIMFLITDINIWSIFVCTSLNGLPCIKHDLQM